MWIKNKFTGKYECLSPAEAKYKIYHNKYWQDTQSKYCSLCGDVNHRELTHCKSCGNELME